MNDEIETRPHVLIVDDQQVNIKILADVLKDDYTLSFATNGEEALKLINAEQQTDMILLDVVMPDMDGFSFCEVLKSNVRTSNIPIIFVTSMSEEVNEEQGFKLGAVDYITKPINPAIVRARVSIHLQLQKHREFLEKLLERRTEDLMGAQKEARALFDWIQKKLM